MCECVGGVRVCVCRRVHVCVGVRVCVCRCVHVCVAVHVVLRLYWGGCPSEETVQSAMRMADQKPLPRKSQDSDIK